MKALLQRVARANVTVDGRVHGEIGPGLLVLLGIGREDSNNEIPRLVKKVLQLRIFNDPDDKMNLSVVDTGGDLLIVSQFTLFADSRKGNRPSYIKAAHPDIAIPLYEKFIEEIRSKYHGKIACGIFGADMQVSLINDGPVTILLDTDD